MKRIPPLTCGALVNFSSPMNRSVNYTGYLSFILFTKRGNVSRCLTLICTFGERWITNLVLSYQRVNFEER